MKLGIEWVRAIALKDASRENLIYSANLEKLPRFPGIYALGRRWGDGFEALYVGKTSDVRGRVRGQFKNLPLMLHLQNAKSGKRILLAGRVVRKRGQRLEKTLRLSEPALVRYFLSEGHDLVNKQGTRLRRHEISSGKHPKRFIPRLIYLEKAKGE